ncbi:nitrogen permease regulator 2-domain-containing protein [Armillaria luteobubalina]|uniref:Nitrogen permease regulator 2-domain-containing protein n=1 Tax=Armillaria luteobubalina TaxID=153913 RepID=A0AA39QI76_9AGAR|nr:nitrogen permease regulator 2-domain-containing protein [Armillaria luteobubalina]
MPSDGDSFLPRIQSVFYSIFDNQHGPKIVYQVPEALIATTPSPSSISVPPTPATDAPPSPRLSSRNSSSSLISPVENRALLSLNSPNKRSTSSNRVLFNFDDISKYVIPPSPLCGRLVICSTKHHRIIGFPVELRGPYERNYFRYNLCFVFERGADLSCYEPIVRKVSRVLTSCEEESAFLSSPETSHTVHAILEQLYEDLNSYAETSIPIDQFNSIELKIFPFYPNPPTVTDWMVPVALINLSRQIEENWDLTMVKICQFIDGTNHVGRIARLADCDSCFARQAIAHLLYYQVIMTVDIFQYSNMYTLNKSIQWLADEPHVKEECGPYVTKPGRIILDWPQLLHLYSRMKPGITVFDWMDTHEVDKSGIDVRRFTSFGVIKGFLRRVHRWPILLHSSCELPPVPTRPRVKSFSGTSQRLPLSPIPSETTSSTNLLRGRFPYTAPINASVSPDVATSAPPTPRGVSYRPRRPSAAEKVLEQLKTRDQQQLSSSPRISWIHQPSGSPSNLHPGITATSSTPQDSSPSSSKFGSVESRRQSAVLVPPAAPPSSPNLPKATLTTPGPVKPRISRSPSAPLDGQMPTTGGHLPLNYPAQLLPLLDGEHHTDELSVRFEIGWAYLEQWLIAAGRGQGNGDYGQIQMIFR